jgi:hypothetical protein
VLLKFKLLELNQVENKAFRAWATGVPYLIQLHQNFGEQMPMQGWLEDMLLDLERSKALAFQDNMIVNL